MSFPLPRAFASAFLTVAIITTATAAVPATQSHPCAAVTDASERLACYDAAFPPAAGVRSSVDIQAENQKALQDFGLNKVQLRVRDPDRMREVEPDRIEGAIAHISTLATGERVVGLDSGQLWRLTEVTSKGRLAIGDQVVVRVAALGSYMLLTPKGVALRARRIK